MEEFELSSWAEFHGAITQIRSDYAKRVAELSDGRTLDVKNDILFRGQTNSDWKLQTTLDRIADRKYSVGDYVQRADSVVNEIESVTGADWKLPRFPAMCQAIKANSDSMRAYIPCYEFLVYLRHHGFPSPLLDWTRSPYIAAYFALEQPSASGRCSIFAFIETPEGIKAKREGDAMITVIGPHITTHARHFAQKASYTIATRWDRVAETHHFASHDDIGPSSVVTQDVLIRITIPRGDRVTAL